MAGFTFSRMLGAFLYQPTSDCTLASDIISSSSKYSACSG